jgi:mycoredoxin
MPTQRKAFYKQPAFIIFTLFIVGFFVLQHFSKKLLSDEPLILTNPEPVIIMYGTQNCPYCVLTKTFFEKHKLPYIEYDIERSEKHMKMFYLLGGKGTPLIIINKEIIHGFDESLMRKAL